MSDFKAKTHQIVCRLGLCPRPCWGYLQRSPDPLAILGGLLLLGGEKTRGEGRGEEREIGSRDGEGRRQGRPQAKAWPPELFSWRRRWS